MLRHLTVSVLGCILLSSCQSYKVEPVQISATPIEKPILTLPQADQVFMKPVEWILVTEETFPSSVLTIKEQGRPVVFFSLTDEGYSNLGLNISAIRALIQQQEVIIQAYKNYYEEAQRALEEANKEIEETAAEGSKGQIVVPSEKKWWKFK